MTPKSKTANGGAGAAGAETSKSSNLERESVFNAFRQWGYLEGDLDPLGFLRPRPTVELQIDSEYAREARAIYSSTIGVEINHIYAPERRRWIYEQMESPSQGFEVTEKDQQRILDLLIRADIFEQTGVLGEFGNWATLRSAPDTLLDKYGIYFCLLARGSPMAFVLPLLPDWKVIYSDNSSVIFMRIPARSPLN